MSPHKTVDQVLDDLRAITTPAILNEDAYARVEVDLLTSACWQLARMQDQIKRIQNRKNTMTARTRRLEARLAARDASIAQLQYDYAKLMELAKWGKVA